MSKDPAKTGLSQEQEIDDAALANVVGGAGSSAMAQKLNKLEEAEHALQHGGHDGTYGAGQHTGHPPGTAGVPPAGDTHNPFQQVQQIETQVLKVEQQVLHSQAGMGLSHDAMGVFSGLSMGVGAVAGALGLHGVATPTDHAHGPATVPPVGHAGEGVTQSGVHQQVETPAPPIHTHGSTTLAGVMDSVGSMTVGAASGVYNYQATTDQADAKDLQANAKQMEALTQQLDQFIDVALNNMQTHSNQMNSVLNNVEQSSSQQQDVINRAKLTP